MQRSDVAVYLSTMTSSAYHARRIYCKKEFHDANLACFDKAIKELKEAERAYDVAERDPDLSRSRREIHYVK